MYTGSPIVALNQYVDLPTQFFRSPGDNGMPSARTSRIIEKGRSQEHQRIGLSKPYISNGLQKTER
jgi:hypothetical protein